MVRWPSATWCSARHCRCGDPFPEGIEQAIFGMGCFWGAERIFWEAPGVYTTAVGYAGGVTPNPTYEEVCSGRTGHAEVVLVAFDAQATSYEEMLRLFWEGHDPTQGMRQGNDGGTQYRSLIVLLPDEAQLRARRGFVRRLPADAHGRRPRRDHDRNRLPRMGRHSHRSITPRTTTSSTSRRTPAATAAWVAPACPARSVWRPAERRLTARRARRSRGRRSLNDDTAVERRPGHRPGRRQGSRGPRRP